MNEYFESLAPSEEVRAWYGTTLKNYLEKYPQTAQGVVEHVLDYLCSEKGPKKLRKMSFPQAKAKAEAWVKSLKKKGAHIKEQPSDVKAIHEFSNGSRIVQLLHKRAYQREGFLMSHCVGSYADKNVTVYSYRDAKNMPHATFEVSKAGDEILQVKGKGNGPIHPKYIDAVIAFLTSIGHPVRSSEMRLLGYYEMSDVLKKQLEVFEHNSQIVSILGKEYVVEKA